MKINPEKVKERLAGVPPSHRSHIYNASIVLEFLAQTFMPTRFFLPEGFNPEPGMPLGEKSMRKISADKEMTIGDLYNLYLMFREEKDYTARIESRYIFGIIIRHLRYYRNGWEFVFWRVGVAQIWHLGPVLLRSKVPAEQRRNFPPKVERKEVEAATVEADPVQPVEEEPYIDSGYMRPEIVKGQPSKMVEAAPGFEPPEIPMIEIDVQRFKEAKYEVDVQPSVDEGF